MSPGVQVARAEEVCLRERGWATSQGSGRPRVSGIFWKACQAPNTAAWQIRSRWMRLAELRHKTDTYPTHIESKAAAHQSHDPTATIWLAAALLYIFPKNWHSINRTRPVIFTQSKQFPLESTTILKSKVFMRKYIKHVVRASNKTVGSGTAMDSCH